MCWNVFIIIGIQNDYLNILSLRPGTNNVKFTNYTFCNPRNEQ